MNGIRRNSSTKSARHSRTKFFSLCLCVSRGEISSYFGDGGGVVMLGTLRAVSSGTGADSDGFATVSDD